MNTRNALPLLLAACVALAAAGCGGDDPASPPTGGQTVSDRPSAPPPSDLTHPTPPKASSGSTVTVTGTVTPGVEPGCRLLDEYLLIGGPADVLRDGARVTVTGRVEPDLMTTCQQGTPLRVESAHPA